MSRQLPPAIAAGALGCVAAVGGALAAVIAAAGAAVAAAVVDARTGEIPDSLVVATAAPAVVGGFVAGRLDAVVLGAVLLGGPLFVLHLVSPAAMGFGDVKLGSALGAAVGLLDARLALVALAVASASAAVFGLVRRRAESPFGPALVGGVCIVAAAAPLGNALIGGAP